MVVKYLIGTILLVLCCWTALNAEEPSAERTNLQTQVIRHPGKIILSIEGAHPSLPKSGLRIVSLTRFSGRTLDRGRLIDIQRVPIKNSALKSQLTYPQSTLTPGLYICRIKKATETHKPEHYFHPAIIMIGSLPEVEKYYNQNSKDLFDLLIGLTGLPESTKAQESDITDDRKQKNILRRIDRQLSRLKRLEQKVTKTIEEGIHLDSFDQISSALTEYAGLITAVVKRLEAKKPIHRRWWQWWTRKPNPNQENPNKEQLKDATRFFAREMVLKLHLEIKVIFYELSRLPDAPRARLRIKSSVKSIRKDINFMRQILPAYPQDYPGVITENRIKPLQEVVTLIDNLAEAFEQSLIEHNRIIVNEELENDLKNIERLLEQPVSSYY